MALKTFISKETASTYTCLKEKCFDVLNLCTGQLVNFYPPVVDCVLLAAGRNYSSD